MNRNSLGYRLLRRIIKILGVRWMWRKIPIGGIDIRTEFDIWQRPAYAYGVYSAAHLASRLGINSITAIEFGVGGGVGLLALEDICQAIGKHFGIKISVVGFDSGCGLPKPKDYRDLPHVWNEGFFVMDVDALRKRLREAKLILGDVEKTVETLIHSSRVSPIGFISFDLDYYSSTKKAFKVFEGTEIITLPRVFCYFDDTIWPERACYSEYSGEYLAINEFNSAHRDKKISKLPHLSWMRAHPAAWNEQIYVFHDFCHQQYATNITPPTGKQLPL